MQGTRRAPAPTRTLAVPDRVAIKDNKMQKSSIMAILGHFGADTPACYPHRRLSYFHARNINRFCISHNFPTDTKFIERVPTLIPTHPPQCVKYIRFIIEIASLSPPLRPTTFNPTFLKIVDFPSCHNYYSVIVLYVLTNVNVVCGQAMKPKTISDIAPRSHVGTEPW